MSAEPKKRDLVVTRVFDARSRRYGEPGPSLVKQWWGRRATGLYLAAGFCSTVGLIWLVDGK